MRRIKKGFFYLITYSDSNSYPNSDKADSRYPKRQLSSPKRLKMAITKGITNSDEPTLRVALSSNDADKWKAYFNTEVNMLMESGNFKIVKRATNESVRQ